MSVQKFARNQRWKWGVPILFIILLVTLIWPNIVHGQEYYGTDIVTCPAFEYGGQRIEWERPFKSTGSFTTVTFAELEEYTVQHDWCEVPGTIFEALPHEILWMLYVYKDTSNPVEGQVINYEIVVNLDSREVVSITDIRDRALLAPRLSGGYVVEVLNWKNMYPALNNFPTPLFLPSGEYHGTLYLQFPTGELATVQILNS